MHLLFSIRSTLLTLVLAAACNNGGDRDKGLRESTKEPARPSDGGEGVPGYLADPLRIVLSSNSDSTLTVSAPGGAIGGQADAVTVYVWRVATTALDSFFSKPQARIVATGTLETKVRPDSLGAFAATVKALPDAVLVLTTEPPAGDGQLVVAYSTPERITTIIKDPTHADITIPILLTQGDGQTSLWTTEQQDSYLKTCTDIQSDVLSKQEMGSLCQCWCDSYTRRWTYATWVHIDMKLLDAYSDKDYVLKACEEKAISVIK